MKATRKTRRYILLLGLIGCRIALAQDVILVANPNVQISSISEADVRAIFLGTKTRLDGGAHAVPVTLRGGPVHEVFLKHHLGESPDQFRTQWRKAVFTGQGAMPRAFDSEVALIEYVAATPGALGYVSHVSPHDNVKCIPITK
jgi:ABC-type phosphate transport system substrate-binding protein